MAKRKYEGIEAEQMESKRPTDLIGKKPEVMFLNKKDGLGRAYTIEFKKVKLTLPQVQQANADAKLFGFVPEFETDSSGQNVCVGGMGKVPKDYEVKQVMPSV